jgi:uncharacterized DUF497 family protein
MKYSFEWDETKEKRNIKDHKISFAECFCQAKRGAIVSRKGARFGRLV